MDLGLLVVVVVVMPALPTGGVCLRAVSGVCALSLSSATFDNSPVQRLKLIASRSTQHEDDARGGGQEWEEEGKTWQRDKFWHPLVGMPR